MWIRWPRVPSLSSGVTAETATSDIREKVRTEARAVQRLNDACLRNAEKAAFVLAASLGKKVDSDEYWRKWILGKALLVPYKAPSLKSGLTRSICQSQYFDCLSCSRAKGVPGAHGVGGQADCRAGLPQRRTARRCASRLCA